MSEARAAEATATVRARPCPVCGGAAREGFRDCFCCRTLRRQLGSDLAPVTAIADYVVGDGLHRLLRGYKDGPSAGVRRLRARELSRRLHRWFEDVEEGRAGAGWRWDVVAAVPSAHRQRAPVVDLVRGVAGLACRYQDLLEPGPQPAGHLRASADAFVIAAGAGPRSGRRRVLLVDDTLTTGAVAQSAAHALRRAGFDVVGIVALGRARRPSGGRHAA